MAEQPLDSGLEARASGKPRLQTKSSKPLAVNGPTTVCWLT